LLATAWRLLQDGLPDLILALLTMTAVFFALEPVRRIAERRVVGGEARQLRLLVLRHLLYPVVFALVSFLVISVLARALPN